MYKNTISSLALLYANYYAKKRDYIETFVPFIATLIKKYEYEKIIITDICNHFTREFGLIIPYHPMQTILTRCKRRGLIDKESGQFIPSLKEVDKYEFSKNAAKELRNQEKLICEISKFASEKHNYNMTNVEVEDSLISFLKDYDLEIIFASEENSLLPDVSIKKKDKFIIYSFVKYTYDTDNELFQYVVKTSIGHLMANSILYKDFSRYVSKLKNVCLYFDTNLIFRLLGLEGNERKAVYIEFLNTLKREGACFYLFNHTYEEIVQILDESKHWVDSPVYDSSKASSVTRYFVNNGYNKLDVQRYINNLEDELSNVGIYKSKIVDTPDKVDRVYFKIDEQKLYDIIVSIYKQNIPNFEEYAKEYTIQKDIDSIAAIYKLRGDNKPRFLKDAGHIFLTTNGSLAYAARKYEVSETQNKDYLPGCLTDIFVGTILWLQSPAKILEINERNIIAQCYAALKPDSLLLKIFIHTIDKLKSENNISENDYYLLRTSQVAENLLEEKTLGDPDNFNDKLTYEILEEIKKDIRKVENAKYKEEKISHEKTKEKLQEYQKQSITFSLRVEKIVDVISRSLSYLLTVICFIGLAFNLIQIFDPVSKPKILNILLIAIYSLLGFLGIYSSFNIKDFRIKIKEYLKDKIYNFFTS